MTIERKRENETVPMGFMPFAQLTQELEALNDHIRINPSAEAYSRYLSTLTKASIWLSEHANSDNSMIKKFRAFLFTNVRNFISRNLTTNEINPNDPEAVKFVQESDQLSSLLAWTGDKEEARNTLFRVYKLGLNDESLNIALAEAVLEAPFENSEAQLKILDELDKILQDILESNPKNEKADNLWSRAFIERKRIELNTDIQLLLDPDTTETEFMDRYKEFAKRKAEIELIDNESDELLELATLYKELFSRLITELDKKDTQQLIAIAKQAKEEIY